jgi:hypothetical protein
MKPKLLIVAVALAAISILTGCAGSAVDRDFRSKVKSDTTDLQGTYDPQTKAAGGELRNTIEFRDPNAAP